MKFKTKKPIKPRPDYRVRIDSLRDCLIVLDRTNPDFLEWKKRPENEGEKIPDKFLGRCSLDLLLNIDESGEELWKLICQKKDLEIKFSELIKELLEKEDEINEKLKEIFDFPTHKSRSIIKLAREDDNGSK